MKLSSELRESVNKKMDVALKGDFAKVDADVLSSSNTFTAEQDKQLQIAIDETAKANQEAQQEQEKKISSAETEVEKEKTGCPYRATTTISRSTKRNWF